MHPGKIVGRVIATLKVETLKGVKLLLVQPTDWNGKPEGEILVAADAVGSGDEEWIFFVKSREAAVAFPEIPPVDACIVGIIDGVNLETSGR